jgi:hypothetical protein
MSTSNNYSNQIFKSDANDFRVTNRQGNAFQKFQDPTYLGFKLFFHGIGIGVNNKENDRLDANPDTLKNVTNTSGLFGHKDNVGSARYYLNKIGDSARLQMLDDLQNMIIKVNTEFPWYFQTIEGLDEAWKRDFAAIKFKKTIKIGCLESLDLRITAIMDLYRKIAFDWTNRREILTGNLRKFSVSIMVYDNRNFRRDLGADLERRDASAGMVDYTDINKQKTEENISMLGDDFSNTNQIMFNLHKCQFLPDESVDVFSSVSNVTNQQASQSISFTYEIIEEDNIYRILGSLSENPKYYYVRDYLNKELVYLTSVASTNSPLPPNDLIRQPVGADNPNLAQNAPLESASTFPAEAQRNQYEDSRTPPTLLESIGNRIQNSDAARTLDNIFGDIGDVQGNNFTKSDAELGNVYGFNTNTDILSGNSIIADIGNNLARDISGAAANAVTTRLNSLFLGNVYGFSPRTDLNSTDLI